MNGTEGHLSESGSVFGGGCGVEEVAECGGRGRGARATRIDVNPRTPPRGSVSSRGC